MTVNGETIENKLDNGFMTIITRNWKKNDKIELDFPVEVKEVLTSEKVLENKGKVALEYGPIVYPFWKLTTKMAMIK